MQVMQIEFGDGVVNFINDDSGQQISFSDLANCFGIESKSIDMPTFADDDEMRRRNQQAIARRSKCS
jgi:hypothetical protein